MTRTTTLLTCAALALLSTTACKKSGSGPIPDAGPDAHIVIDATPGDAPIDGSDADHPAVPTCDIGVACNPDRGCRSSSTCIAEQMSTNPVEGHPDGDATFTTTSWLGGYCSNAGTVDSGGCDPDAEGACGSCGVCLRAGTDSGGAQVTLCARTCEPSLDDNPCRDGYVCDLGSSACLPGCTSDDDCAIYSADTDGDGVNEYVYDVDGSWTCNTATARCEHVAPDGAEAGIACTLDSDCENHGRCIDEATYEAWGGGYCLKFGCDVPGNECAGDGVCDTRALGSAVCLAPCEVGATDPADDPYANARDCRGGYACTWNGVDAAGPDDGVCVPGNYDDVRDPNTGASCDAAGDGSECHSPWGQGQCRDWDDTGPGGGYCTVFDCGAPGIDSEVACGTGNVCASVSGSATTLCLQACDSADDCTEGYGCWDTTDAGIGTGGTTVCFAGCREDADCRSGESCAGATATMLGECS